MTLKSFINALSDDHYSLPMYQKIKEYILEKIGKGEWLANQKLPSENEISAELGISRMTVNRAFKELTEEGYLFREKGAGTFVAEPFQLIPFFELIPISQELAIEGNPFSSTILQLGKVSDPKLILEQYFSVENVESSDIFYSEIIYNNALSPIQYEKRYVLASFAPKYLKQTFDKDCALTYLQALSPILSQKHTLEAIIPNSLVQERLQLVQGEACFKVTEELLIREQIISYSEQFYAASRYKFHSKI